MYESFFGLTERPFSIRPDPRFLFLSHKHQRALSILEYGLMNQGGFTVVTGAIGSGKTTLVRKLLQKIDDDLTIGLVSNTHCDGFEELLRWILLAFKLEYRNKDKVELFETLTGFLFEESEAGRRVVLVIDEAQNLEPQGLEQLRMLSNVNTDQEDCLHLMLLGQPELWRRLRSPELLQFAQRIAADYHLGPLDAEEAKHYIQHRLAVVGGAPELFADDTYHTIWERTKGVPRLINILCDTALVYSFADQKTAVDLGVIQSVIEDKHLGIAPLRQQHDQYDGSTNIRHSNSLQIDQYRSRSK
jgi:type II secretory pathway predicted ATPase ExeA